jgi:hypothetical protein
VLAVFLQFRFHVALGQRAHRDQNSTDGLETFVLFQEQFSKLLLVQICTYQCCVNSSPSLRYGLRTAHYGLAR